MLTSLGNACLLTECYSERTNLTKREGETIRVITDHVPVKATFLVQLGRYLNNLLVSDLLL